MEPPFSCVSEIDGPNARGERPPPTLTVERTRHSGGGGSLDRSGSAYSALLCSGASVGWVCFSLPPRKKIKQRIARTTKKPPAILKRVVPLNSIVRGGDLDQTNWGSVAATLLIKSPQSNGATNPRNNPRARRTSALFISQLAPEVRPNDCAQAGRAERIRLSTETESRPCSWPHSSMGRLEVMRVERFS